jgi:hypothetical protein
MYRIYFHLAQYLKICMSTENQIFSFKFTILLHFVLC